jgi:hypothetical protein
MHSLRSRVVVVAKAALTFLFTIMLCCLQVTPDGAASNAAAWARRFGASGLPAWLTREQTDRYLTWAVAMLLAATIAWIMWPNLRALLAWAKRWRVFVSLERAPALSYASVPRQPIEGTPSSTTLAPPEQVTSLVAQSCFLMTTGESGQFCRTRVRPIHGTERTFMVRIDNVHEARAVTDIKVTVLEIEPQTDYSGPWVLEAGFALAAGDHMFVPLARYGEASRAPCTASAYDRSETFFEILTKGTRPALSNAGIHRVTIRATGIGSAPRDYQCKIWVDRSDGRLRIVPADAGTATSVPLGSPLRIEFGSDERYEKTQHFNDTGVLRRTIHVSVRNDSLTDIPDCRLALVASTPQLLRAGVPSPLPVFLAPDFDLGAGSSKFVSLASFAERPGNTDPIMRDNIIISTRVGGIFGGWTTLSAPSQDNPATITLEASAPGIRTRKTHLSTWVDQPMRRLCAAII